MFLFLFLFVCLFVCFVCLFVCCLFVCLFVFLVFICLFISLFVFCLFVPFFSMNKKILRLRRRRILLNQLQIRVVLENIYKFLLYHWLVIDPMSMSIH